MCSHFQHKCEAREPAEQSSCYSDHCRILHILSKGEEDTLNCLLSAYQTEASAISKFSTYRLKELGVVIFAPRKGMVSGQEQSERA